MVRQGHPSTAYRTTIAKANLQARTLCSQAREGRVHHTTTKAVDAIIGLSVVYKSLDNLGAYKHWFGIQPDTRAVVLVFGFFHGFGSAAKLQDLKLSPDGLVPNMLAFTVGVELGQLLAPSATLVAMAFWRRSAVFHRHAFAANALLMTAGFDQSSMDTSILASAQRFNVTCLGAYAELGPSRHQSAASI